LHLGKRGCRHYVLSDMTLHVLVLGSAAGGGLPQWNCGCDNCAAAREGRLAARTQDSVAVSSDGERWFLLNASPDVLHQARAHRQLWPRSLRQSPILGVVLTNGDLDHVLGLWQLRESQSLSLYATERVLSGLAANAAHRTLQRFEGQLRQAPLLLGDEQELLGPSGEPSGLWVSATAVAGKPPLHLARSHQPSREDNVALRIRAGHGGDLVYASAIADAAGARDALAGCQAVLLDGTFWSEEELPELGVPVGAARSMAHQPIGGPEGTLQALRELAVPRRIYTHVNNTNPVLREASPERMQLEAAGWELAYDGMQLRLG
jgi:pyrroloquinoline quinone biosynthesis protein B